MRWRRRNTWRSSSSTKPFHQRSPLRSARWPSPHEESEQREDDDAEEVALRESERQVREERDLRMEVRVRVEARQEGLHRGEDAEDRSAGDEARAPQSLAFLLAF